MAKPVANDVRTLLEGYGFTSSVITDAWLDACLDTEIIPHIEDVTRMSFDGEETVQEFYNGNGMSVLILNRKPVVEVINIKTVGAAIVSNLVNATELVPDEGMIKARTNYNEGIYGPIFPRGDKNIKVTYTYGFADYPPQVFRAVTMLCAAKALALIGARTGGGDVSVQAHSRSYGPGGKYADIRKELIASGYALLRKYMTGVVGS